MAREGAENVKVEYQEKPAILTIEDAIKVENSTKVVRNGQDTN